MVIVRPQSHRSPKGMAWRAECQEPHADKAPAKQEDGRASFIGSAMVVFGSAMVVKKPKKPSKISSK